ncbi:hypothetical protein JZU56_06275, partial [bacterium]|nr:hypothetical protein [bacterium]
MTGAVEQGQAPGIAGALGENKIAPDGIAWTPEGGQFATGVSTLTQGGAKFSQGGAKLTGD